MNMAKHSTGVVSIAARVSGEFPAIAARASGEFPTYL
jgi:hypothetical protein